MLTEREPASDETLPRIGVVIVTYNSANEIGDCLRSLLRSRGIDLRIVVVDNASTDQTCAVVREVAAEGEQIHEYAERQALPAGRIEHRLTLLRNSHNGGYAHGVNRALDCLLDTAGIDLFWILNPDCAVDCETAAQYYRAGKNGNFSLMSGRTVYFDRPDSIQSDGGRVSRLTGVCHPLNLGASAHATPMPRADQIDFVTGANCVASRKFVEQAGLMNEAYFLYYEEVDWAFRRGSLELRIAPDVTVRHHGGTSIGSGSLDRRPSAYANYVNARSRMLFLRRFLPWSIPFALAHAFAKAMQLMFLGDRAAAAAILRGILQLPAPIALRSRLPAGLGRD